MRIRDLKGLGKQSETMLAEIGINTVEQFKSNNPYLLYQQLYKKGYSKNLNMLYAMIGAQENEHWQAIAKTRKTEILLTLDGMGLAPN